MTQKHTPRKVRATCPNTDNTFEKDYVEGMSMSVFCPETECSGDGVRPVLNFTPYIEPKHTPEVQEIVEAKSRKLMKEFKGLLTLSDDEWERMYGNHVILAIGKAIEREFIPLITAVEERMIEKVKEHCRKQVEIHRHFIDDFDVAPFEWHKGRKIEAEETLVFLSSLTPPQGDKTEGV